MSGLFPTKPQPNIDPHSDTHWSSPEAKLNGAMAELYQCIPKALHKLMETYSQFGSVFRAAVSSERSNILHSLKDCTGLIFSGLKLDLTIFTDEPAKKKENEQLLALLKKDVVEIKYTRLAPILFMDPSALVPDDFLKTPVMVKVSNTFSCWSPFSDKLRTIRVTDPHNIPSKMGQRIWAEVMYILDVDGWAGGNIISDGDGWAGRLVFLGETGGPGKHDF
ncbi:hypothetical protein BDR07DRAFT_1495605 [Suillus spraguei]|nr:hypothetical protein BDR07DRAFT_1495605 [Suillus spraguei]